MDPSLNNTVQDENSVLLEDDQEQIISETLEESNLDETITDLPQTGIVRDRISVFEPENDSVISGPSTDNSVNEKSVTTSLTNTIVKPTISIPSGMDKFNIFKNEYIAIRSNNLHVLRESKECKRLLDLKYNDLVFVINNIQTSVIFTSTISGFLQATKLQFGMSPVVVSIVSITIATYISLILSISKYYALDELKERIQLLREKYSLLLNEVDYNMDKLGPWSMKRIWKYENHETKYEEWNLVKENVNGRYNEIVNTKKELVTEYECIMDTKSRNHYHIKNKKLNLENRKKVYESEKKEVALETTIAMDKKAVAERAKLDNLELKHHSIVLSTEELDNWSFDADEWSSV